MRHVLPCGWAGIGLLVSLLLCGCQHSAECFCPEGACVTLQAPTPLSTYATNALPTAATPAAPSGAALQSSSEEASEALGGARSTQAPSVGTSLEDRNAGKLAHDPDYHWLMGTLEYSRIQQAWLLHYVPFDQDDRYGGCVMLVASERQMKFKPGQLVRVEGALIDPESHQLQPAFEVDKIAAQP
jgi:hypothetical protein